jgi:hypothetical protein
MTKCIGMGYLSTFLSTRASTRKAAQSVSRLDMTLAVVFTLSLVVGMSFCNEEMTTACWTGVGLTGGMCALLFCASRQKWTMLLLSLVLLAARMAFGFLAALPDAKGLFASCFASCILFAALILKKTRVAAL